MMATLFLLLAHDEQLLISEVRVSEREVRWTVDIGIVRLHKSVGFPVEPPEVIEEDVEKAREAIVRHLLTAYALEVNGRAAALEAGRTEAVREPFLATGEKVVAHVKQELLHRSAEPVRKVTLRYQPFRDGFDSQSSVQVVREGRKVGLPHVRSDGFEIDLDTDASLWSFLRWGMHHIVVGYDHVAFLLALLLVARTLVEMLKIVTSFTVAHSITLLLAALDVLRLEPRVTEALIAASIVYVAAENYLIRGEAKFRWVLTFGFGLVHGLGFAGVLRGRLEMVEGVAGPVVLFNVGVELGQIAILLIAFPLLVVLRRAATEEGARVRQRRLVWIGSAPIGLFGAGWLVDRLFGTSLMGWLG